MVEKSELHALEEELAASIEGPSCTPGHIAREILGLTEVKKPLVIVDLASGTSPMVAELIDEGVQAHGVDIAYGKTVDEIVKGANVLLAEMAASAPYGYGERMHAHGNAAIEKFRASFQSHRENYHLGFLTRLPFTDNFADIVASLNGITALAENVDLMMERIHEALRITKPGGRIVLSPIHSWYDENFDHFAGQHEEMTERLEAEGYKIEIEEGITVKSDLLLPDFTRMIIVKPQE